MFCITRPSNGLVCVPNTAPYLSGFTGLQGARNIAYWDENRGRWEGTLLWEPMQVNSGTPMLLIRRQDAFFIRGVGDALEYLATSCAQSQGERGVKAITPEVSRCIP